MSAPSSPLQSPRLLILVIGTVVVVVAGALLIVALTPSSTGTSRSSPAPTESCRPPPPAGGPTIVSCTAVVNNARPVDTSAFSAPAGSLVLVFLSFVGANGGGGGPDLIVDSMNDPFAYITGAGPSQNPTEELYAADVRAADPNMTVSVAFGGGSAPQGGSVAIVDVADATLGSIGAFVSSTGTGATASLALNDSAPGDLLLLGVVGPGSSGPYAPAGGETLLDTGNATSGPFEDSLGYGTFAIERNTSTTGELSAGLHAPSYWDAIGVSISLGSPFVPPPVASTCTPPASSAQPSVYSCAGAVSNQSPVRTLAIPTETDSLVLVFVSYVNTRAGGPVSDSISDSNADTYTFLNSTGLSLNHTEELYATQIGMPVELSVAVSFSGGATPSGGSVAVVDIANASLASIVSTVWTTGLHGSANVTLTTSHSGDLFLLGTASRGVSGPYSAGPGETLLDTGSADSGPFEDGTGYGTFAMTSAETTVTLRANLNYPTFWDAIGVAVTQSVPSQVSSRCTPPGSTGGPAVESCVGTVGNETVTTPPPFNASAHSLLLVFVSYCNSLIGGGAPSGISDSLGDTYTYLGGTGLAINHTEELYATDVSSAAVNMTVSVTFTGGATPQGGSVAAVDVANSNLTSIDSTGWNTGLIGDANVTLETTHTEDLFLFGAAGRGVSGPYGPGPNMTLLDTGTATAGPYLDGIGYGTFSTTSADTSVTLSATLHYPTYWEAVGVAISSVALGPPSMVAHAGTVNNHTTVVTAPIDAAANSLLLVFVSYVNYEAGGGTPTSIVDSTGDSFSLLATTGDALNHTENLYAVHRVQANSSVVVSVTFGGGDTPQGGSVAVVDVANATLATIDAIGVTTGTGGFANLTLVANHPGDLYLYGTAGRGVSAPFSPGPGMTLLDTGTNTSGPFLDGTGYGMFMTTSTRTSASLSATLNVATGWDAIGVAIDP